MKVYNCLLQRNLDVTKHSFDIYGIGKKYSIKAIGAVEFF